MTGLIRECGTRLSEERDYRDGKGNELALKEKGFEFFQTRGSRSLESSDAIMMCCFMSATRGTQVSDEHNSKMYLRRSATSPAVLSFSKGINAPLMKHTKCLYQC